MLVDKVQFLANVINCSVQTDSRTDHIKIIVNAAKAHQGMAGVTIKEVPRKFHEGSSQSGG